MSADNGIYILETPKGDKKEYRVAHLQGIDNIYYHDATGDLITMWVMFSRASLFDSEEKATLKAHELSKDYDVLEYGVSSLKIDKEFPRLRPVCPDHKLAENCSPPTCLRCGEDFLPKSELKDGVYYAGHCRNADAAVWDAENQLFWYMRTKFRDRFHESISHPSDDNGFDLFYPEKETEPTDNQRVDFVAAKKQYHEWQERCAKYQAEKKP